MRRLLQILLVMVLWSGLPATESFAETYCWNCGAYDYDDEDFSCDECVLCEECQYSELVHCPECNECQATYGYLCEGCNMCENCVESHIVHCLECDGCYDSVGDICYGCGMCHECQNDALWHCRMCQECQTEECYECCALCASCAYDNNAHCYECGGCFEDGVETCSECSMCSECAMEGGRHCEGCRGCFDFDTCCPSCYMCPSCATEFNTHCYACNGCADDVGDICEECHMCPGCAYEYQTHCGDCEECKPMEVCENCLLCYDCAIDNFYHCEGCLECKPDEVCQDCYLCPDCAIDFEVHCKNCGENHVENGGCENCGLCEECVDSEMLHCQDCGGCPSDVDYCEECHYCVECGVRALTHCQNCEECFESDGGVCDECRLCPECALDDEVHCPECGEHVDLCDECGYCIDCAEDEGYHCPECGECKADDMCEAGGEHCADCCENNGWLCEECGVCVEAENSEKCEDCDLCKECCLTASEDKGCSHAICVESSDWEEHFCDEHDMCRSECPHSTEVGEHVHDFDSKTHICSICKAKENGAPTIYRSPKDVKRGMPATDDEAPETVKFSVGASGEDLEYVWYTCLEAGARASVLDESSVGKLCVSGVGTSEIEVIVPADACNVTHYYYCLVKNAKGSVESAKACIVASHGLAWKDYTHLPASEQAKVTLKTVTITTGAEATVTTYEYSDYHYQICPSEGCGKYVGVKAMHHYGDWVIDQLQSEEGCGSRYKQCEDCGAKMWQEIPKAKVTGEPYIISQPKGLTCKTPNFYAIEECWDGYVCPTATFSVQAGGDGELKYQWYHYYRLYDGRIITRAVDATSSLSGARESTLVVNVPEEGCADRFHKYFCVISNSKGSIRTDTVTMTIKHSMVATSGTKVDASEVDLGETSKYTNCTIDGVAKKCTYYKHHYMICEGCRKYDGDKKAHNYGDWVVYNEPVGANGSMYRECKSCGEKLWRILVKDEKICIVQQPETPSCRATAYDCETGTYDMTNKVTLSVEAVATNGGTIEYCWYRQVGDGRWSPVPSVTKADEEWAEGVRTPKLTIVVPVGACSESYRYRCFVRNMVNGEIADAMVSQIVSLNVDHNLKWMKASQFKDKLTKTYSEYYFDSTKKDSYVSVGDWAHHHVCADAKCLYYKAKSLNKSHDYENHAYKLLSPSTTTSRAVREHYCSKCGSVKQNSIATRLEAGEADPYESLCDVMQVESVNEYGMITGTVLSGIIEGNECSGLYLVYADGTVDKRTVPCIYSDNVGKKGGKASFFQNYIFNGDDYIPRFKTLPAGCYLTNDVSKVKFTSGVTGKLKVNSVVEPYVGESDYYVRINGSYVKTRLMKVGAISKDGKYQVADDTEVVLNTTALIYGGQVLPVYLKSSGRYVELGNLTVKKCDITNPNIWLVTASGDTVHFKREYSITNTQKMTADGKVSWSGNTITLFAGAKISALHIGSEEDYKVLVGDGVSISNPGARGETAALYAAGKLTVLPWKGANVSIVSQRGNSIEARSLVLGEENVSWNVECIGGNYGIKTDTLDFKPGVEAHVKTKLGKMAVAPFILPYSGLSFDGSMICDPSWRNMYILWPAGGKKESVWDNTDDKWVTDFYIRKSPNLWIFDEPVTDMYHKEISWSYEYYFNSGEMLTNESGNVITLKDLQFVSDPDYSDMPMFTFGKSAHDTVYVKVLGDNYLDKTGPYSNASGNSAIYIQGNVKLIGDGTLRIKSENNAGIVLGDNATLTVDDKVTLVVETNTDYYGLTSENGPTKKSKLVIGEKATLDTYSKGIANLGDVVIVGNGDAIEDPADCLFFANEVRDPMRIIYPGAVAYTYNLDGDGMMHFHNSGSYDEHRFIIGDHPQVRLGELWVPAYESSLNKTLRKGIEFSLTQEGFSGTACYDPDSKTLYLDNTTLCGSFYNNALRVREPQFTVVLRGECTFTTTSAVPIVIGKGSSVTFKSESAAARATMIVDIQDNSTNLGFKCARNSKLTFKDVDVVLHKECRIRAIGDNNFLVIDNSTVKFDEAATVIGFKVDLKGVEFEEENLKCDNHVSDSTQSAVIDKTNGAAVNGNFNIVLKSETDPEMPSGLEEISADGLDLSQPMYAIDGRRVYDSYRGVVIQNGKKYLKY